MATPLLQWIEKATFTTADLSGAGNGGELSPQQARQFLRDAITPTAILSRADVVDSDSKKFEIPKLSFANRIMRAGTEGSRLADADRVKPDTDLVTLSTELFKGEVPVSDEVFEDNVEREGFADSLMQMIAEAVGRDIEEIAIKSDTNDTDSTFNRLNGLVQQLVDSTTANKVDAASETSYKGVFKTMLNALPDRYRSMWDQLVFYVPVDVADGYADELGQRGTDVGDSALTTRENLRYRGIPIVEVPLFSGTQNAYDYSKVAILCHPRNLKVGFHRRVRVEKFRDPREGLTSFLPTVRFDVKWAQDSAVVLAQNVPAL